MMFDLELEHGRQIRKHEILLCLRSFGSYNNIFKKMAQKLWLKSGPKLWEQMLNWQLSDRRQRGKSAGASKQKAPRDQQ